MKYIKGEENIADSLSRLTVTNKEIKHEAESYVYHIATNAVPASLSAKEIEQESYEDEEIRLVSKAIQNNDWSSKDVSAAYKAIRNELTCLGKLVLRGTRLVIPKKLRKRILEIGHEGHQGIVRTKQRMRTKVWWPGIDADAEKTCRNCRKCILVSAPDYPQPVVRTKLPDGAWQVLSADLLGPLKDGSTLFIVVDYFSRWFEVRKLRKTTAKDIIKSLDTIWSSHGYPYKITTDNGPQFIAEEFKAYLKELGIEHHHTTPLWPQANGEIERQNRTVLQILTIAETQNLSWKEELGKYLLVYRTTPHTVTGMSPSKLLMNRTPRTKLPELPQYDARDEET